MIFIYSIYSFQIIMAATQNIQNLCGAQKWCMLKTFLGNRTLSGINSARLMFHFPNLFPKSFDAYYCWKNIYLVFKTSAFCNNNQPPRCTLKFVHTIALFRKKRFMLDEMIRWNASKFAKIYIYENPKLLFPFFILCYFIFFPNECPVLCQHRPGHSLGKK